MNAEKAPTERSIKPKPLVGRVEAMSSKSDVHRILICAALADAPTDVRFSTLSEDISTTIGCLQALGAGIEKKEDCWQVTPSDNLGSGHPLLNCKESGSTLRFLIPVAAALRANASFIGEGRLPERPLGPLIDQISQHGCRFSKDRLPFQIGGALTPGHFFLPGNISSQYITGLMLALPKLDKDSQITLTTELESRPYVDMTIATLSRFGIVIHTTKDGYEIPGRQIFKSPGRIMADGDWSNAAFWLCAGALGGPVTCCGLSMQSPQGDKRVLEILREFGARVEVAGDAATVSKGRLTGVEIDASAIPDLVTALVVVAAAAEGTTTIRHAGRLRIKESDRLSALARYLSDLGATVQELPEGLIIHGGGKLQGGCVNGQGDHRIVMSAAIASALCDGEVVIRGAEAVKKSYPQFFKDFEKLGGETHVI